MDKEEILKDIRKGNEFLPKTWHGPRASYMFKVISIGGIAPSVLSVTLRDPIKETVDLTYNTDFLPALHA